MRAKPLVSAALLFLSIAAAGIGQEPILLAKIEFRFMVAGKALPAGDYRFTRDPSATAFRVSDGKMDAALIPVVTRIARYPLVDKPDTYLVFDAVGETYVLSEIWLSGDDGYLVAATKEIHGHKVVPVKR